VDGADLRFFKLACEALHISARPPSITVHGWVDHRTRATSVAVQCSPESYRGHRHEPGCIGRVPERARGRAPGDFRGDLSALRIRRAGAHRLGARAMAGSPRRMADPGEPSHGTRAA